MVNAVTLIFWLARIYIFYESFINFIGVLWFNTSLESGVVIAGSLSAVAGFTVALMPRNFMKKSNGGKLAIVLLCFITICGQIFLILGDLSFVGGLNINNIVKRLLFIFALVVVVAETALLKQKSEINGLENLK